MRWWTVLDFIYLHQNVLSPWTLNCQAWIKSKENVYYRFMSRNTSGSKLSDDVYLLSPSKLPSLLKLSWRTSLKVKVDPVFQELFLWRQKTCRADLSAAVQNVQTSSKVVATVCPDEERLLRVPVGEFDVAAGRQQFAVLQPDEVRLRDAGCRAAEDRAAPCWSGDRLRPLDKLWRGWTHRGGGVNTSSSSLQQQTLLLFQVLAVIAVVFSVHSTWCWKYSDP